MRGHLIAALLLGSGVLLAAPAPGQDPGSTAGKDQLASAAFEAGATAL
jgi:hypothetical protein